jgi:ABC-type branched-subunit amino acid transport system substrate-binding protein
MSISRKPVVALLGVAAVIAAAVLAFTPGVSKSAATNTATTVVVPHGQPIQIAFVGSTDFPDYTQSFRNAVQMAIEQNPAIKGFPIQINDSNPSCGDAGANVAAATAIVSNPQNAAVIGQACSLGFASALPIYQNADLVTISGSATDPSLPGLGPNVFNRTAVEDPEFSAWYGQVKALPSDLAFQQNYQNKFGASPLDYSDLYFDATSLLLGDIAKVSTIVSGNLVIDRAALARAVRNTTNYQGVSCTVTLDPPTGNRVNDPASLAQCAGTAPKGSNGLSAYVIATNKGPLPPCSADGSNCGPANTVWDYIHVVNRNPLLNQRGGSRATVPNALVINSVDEQLSVNGVDYPLGDATFTPPPNVTPFRSASGRWPATVVCAPTTDPPCGDVQDPAVLPGENIVPVYTGWIHDTSDRNGTFVFTYTIHGTLNGNPVDLTASAPPIQMNAG